MGKKRQYKDDYTGDVKSIRQHHKKFRVLVGALCVTGIIAAGGATYVLMNPAQTMTKEGIDEMDPNEDFIVADDDVVQADAFFEDFEDDEQSYVQEENYDDVPLIEEVDNKKKKPADAIPSEDEEETEDAYDAYNADDAVLAGGIAEDMIIADQADTAEEEDPAEAVEAPVEEVQSEAAEASVEEVQSEAAETPVEEVQTEAVEAPAEEVQSEAVEAPAEEVQSEAVEAPAEEMQSEAVEEPAVAEIVGASETEASETLTTEALVVETEQVVLETEAVADETEEADSETEAVASETEEAQTEEVESEDSETEEVQDETEAEPAEPAESETQGSEIHEKSKDEVYVETEGEILDEKWIDSVGLEIKTDDGWDSAETAESGTIVVDADQTLRFRVIYTVQPETLSPDMRTLIYQIPKEVTSVDESYGEIVDADERVIANYAIDNTGVIRVTFTEEIAELNAEGTKVTCKIEFRTQASNLAE